MEENEYPPSLLDAAATASKGHRGELGQSKKCGCYHCVSIFPPSEIKEWRGDGPHERALCPKCGVDSVIGDASGYPVEDRFLRAMRKTSF